MLAEERRQWPLFVPVAIGIGVLLWFRIPLNSGRQMVLLLCLSFSVASFAFLPRWRLPLVALGLLVATGIGVADWRNVRVAEPRLFHYLSAFPMEGSVHDVDIRGGGRYTRIILDRDARFNDPPLTVQLHLDGLPPPGVVPGARIRVNATLVPVQGPTLPNGYSPARDAWFRGVSATGRILSPPVVLEAPERNSISRMRLELGEAITQRLSGQAGAIAMALVTGDQGRVTPEFRESMQIAGLAHLLAVSGFHVSTVAGLAFFATRRLFALVPRVALRLSTKRLATIAAILAAIGYLFLSGVQIPALRATIGVGVAMLGVFFGRNPVTLRLVAFAALVILLWRPESLLSPSFQLSFAAVSALVVLANSGFSRRYLMRQDGDGPLFRGARFLVALFISSLVAEIVLMPIVLAHFGRTGAYGALANMAGIPLTSLVIMPLLGIWLLLMPLGLEGLVGWALQRALDLLAGIATTVAAWPGARAEVMAVPPFGFGLIVAGGILLVLLVGRLRWSGTGLIAAGVAAILIAPSPFLLISPDRGQVALVGDKHLYLLAGHRNGLLVRTWAETTRRPPDRRLTDWPGTRCGSDACAFTAGGVSVLVTREPPGDCRYDIVVSARAAGLDCKPALHLIDAADRLGAVSIDRALHIDSAAARAGDRPWAPDADPGFVERLFGGRKWIGVMVE